MLEEKSDEKPQCLREFSNLPAVAPDFVGQHHTILDCVFSAQHEIDLYEEGESKLRASELRKLRAFVTKWSN
jgi:hypothetical protein